MDRFLKIQIYNSAGTQVQYDNSVDDFWGINAGTALLNRVLMPDELKFGELYSDMFEVNVFGLDTNIDLKGRRIVVSATQENITLNRLKNSDNDLVVDADTNRIATAPTSTTNSYLLFEGYIETSDTDIVKTDRQIVAYDRARELKNTDIATWWNTYWENNPNGVTIATFRNALITAVGLTSASGTYINDSVVIKNPFENAVTSLMFGTVLKMICQLQCTAPTMKTTTLISFVKLGRSVRQTDKNLEGLNSKWEDYTTDTITGVAVYSTSDELAQVVGTADNAYKIAGNAFLLNMSATDITTVGTAILNRLATLSYTPCELNLVISDFRHELGDKINTSNGNAYILEQTLSGSLLINENIICPAISPKLSGVVDDMSDELINGQKFAKITKTIDEFSSEIYDPDTGESKIEQLANKIVLKVDANGNLSKVELGDDPETGQTVTIKAQTINIESDTVKFDNSGYKVKGDTYTTKITPDNNEIFCNYAEIDHDDFPYVDFEDDTKATYHINTYVYGEMYADEDFLNLQEIQLRSFNLTVQQNNTFWKNGNNNNFFGQVVVTGTHFIMTATQWANYTANGGYVDSDGYLATINSMSNYMSTDTMEISTLQLIPQSRPIIAYMEASMAMQMLQMFHVVSYPAYFKNFKGKMPVVICPNISMSLDNIYDWNNKWGSSGTNSNNGLANVTGMLWNKAMNNPVTRAGTIVKTITTANPQRILTAQELANIFGTQSGGTYTAYLMNGDHSAQGADITATYIQSGDVYVRFNTTPTAGAYRFNYMISRF